MNLSIGYSDSEDRLWIRAGNAPDIWWLTRRMAIGLLAQWAGLIEKTVAPGDDGGESEGAGAGRSGDAGEEDAQGLARDRALRVQRERREALAGTPAAESGGAVDAPPPQATDVQNRVLHSVELSAVQGRFRMTLHSAGVRTAWVMSRAEAFRMIDALLRRCARSGWLDARLPDWLLEDLRKAAPKVSVTAVAKGNRGS